MQHDVLEFPHPEMVAPPRRRPIELLVIKLGRLKIRISY
jgi:hypothetical protein